jgi:predicted  nucleic acid-binding Zn-ribbon protein
MLAETMNPDLDGLIRLQRAESELKRVESQQAEVPLRRGEVEGQLAKERSRLDAAKEALEASQKARRRYETELQDLETKRSKYKGQLMEVKTNKEYTAVLHEIETVEREIRSREDQILAEMERAETLSSEIRQEEQVFRLAQEGADRELRALGERGAKLEEEHQRTVAQRDAIAATLREDVLQLFRRVAKLRGVAVAEARDEMCQLCHMKLRLQMYTELKRNDQVVQCPACSRILFFEPPVPVASPEP